MLDIAWLGCVAFFSLPVLFIRLYAGGLQGAAEHEGGMPLPRLHRRGDAERVARAYRQSGHPHCWQVTETAT